jgi:hypothetical protein
MSLTAIDPRRQHSSFVLGLCSSLRTETKLHTPTGNYEHAYGFSLFNVGIQIMQFRVLSLSCTLLTHSVVSQTLSLWILLDIRPQIISRSGHETVWSVRVLSLCHFSLPPVSSVSVGKEKQNRWAFCCCKVLGTAISKTKAYCERGPGFDSRLYQIFWVAASLERGPLSLVRINEELLERKVAAPV